MISLINCGFNAVKHNVSTSIKRNLPNLIATMSRQYRTADKFSVPITDFAQLRQYKYFVDKSPMIETLLNDDNLATFITAPKGFGKSTMLSTLKYFFEIQVDPKDGKAVTKIDLSSDEIITGTTNYDLFKGLKISQSPGAMKHFGKWPVIFVDFKASGPVTCSYDATDIARYSTHKCYKQHSYLLKSRKLSNAAKQQIADWCDDEIYESQSSFDVKHGLKHLCEYLLDHWGKHSIILIDEYDSILMNALACKSNDSNDLTSIIGVVAEILDNVRIAQESYRKILVCGIWDLYDITKVLKLRNKNQFLEDHAYSKFYGLLESEVKELLPKSSSQIPSDEICSYYGYTSLGRQSIFNTWSIMNFLEYQRLEPYSCRPDSILGLYESFTDSRLRNSIGMLIRSDTIFVDLSSALLCNDTIPNIKDFLRNIRSLTRNVMFSFFLEQGLLSAAVVSPPENENTKISRNHGAVLELKIANTEIKENLQLALDKYYEGRLSPWGKKRAKTTAAFGKIFKSINSKNELRCSLAEYLVSIKNFTSTRCFNNYSIIRQDLRSLVAYAAKPLCPTYRLDMNPEESKIANGGSIDFYTLYSGEPHKIAMIINFKIEEKDIETVKDETINGHYIHGLKDNDFKDAKQAIIMGLNIIRPIISNESSREPKFELIYTVCQLDNDENINLNNNEWEILKSE